MMLHHRTDLGLTDEQVSRLEQLRNSFARESIRREADIRVAELDLAEVLSQEPLDLPQAEAKIREAARLRTDLRIARLRTIEQGKAVLTPEQRVKLASLLGGMEPQRRGAAPADRGGARL
jgi:Spy/CpxP family protein refolding chaperone